MSSEWKGRRVLVTGSNGFLGSHLLDALVFRGACVTALVREPAQPAAGTDRLRWIPEETRQKLERIITSDLGYAECIRRVVECKPDTIFHLAAWLPYSSASSPEGLRTNVFGMLNLLEAGRQLKHLDQIVATSSSEVYGSALLPRINEAHPVRPLSPYAASKAAADQFCYAYHTTFGTPVSVIRLFNTYGPRHTHDVIAKLIKLALSNEPLTIYGNGLQERDFVYVDDIVDAFLTIGLNHSAVGRFVNFGSGRSISIRSLAELIRTLATSQSAIEFKEVKNVRASKLCCDPALARRLFGWSAKIELNDGLRRNIEWCRSTLGW